MRLSEAVGFDTQEYTNKLFTRNNDDLAEHIYKKRRAIASSTTSAVAGVAAAHVSAGASLVGTAWSARNVSVECQKLGLLEDEWARRGLIALAARPFVDAIIPAAIAGTVGAFAYDVDVALGPAAGMAVSAAPLHVPSYGLPPHIARVAYDGVEYGMNKLGNAANPVGYVWQLL